MSRARLLQLNAPVAPALVVDRADAGNAPVFLCLPAMGAPAEFYRPLADALAATLAATVACADLRGQGSSRHRARNGADFGYREIVEVDLPALVDQLHESHPERPLYLLGHSLGGQLTVLATERLEAQLAGLILVAAGTAHFRTWPRGHRLRAWLTVQAIRAVAALLPWYPGRRLGFGGDQPRRVMRDWGHNATTGRYRFSGSADDPEAGLERVRLPVLSIEIDGDPIAPAGAIEELLGKLAQAPRERRPIAGIRSHSPWRRHFSWARRPDEVVADGLGAVAAAGVHALTRKANARVSGCSARRADAGYECGTRVVRLNNQSHGVHRCNGLNLPRWSRCRRFYFSIFSIARVARRAPTGGIRVRSSSPR